MQYRITAAPAVHGIETYGYRIDYDGGSLVLSGDTTYAESIVALARGADVLVHEAYMADERPTNPATRRSGTGSRLFSHARAGGAGSA